VDKDAEEQCQVLQSLGGPYWDCVRLWSSQERWREIMEGVLGLVCGANPGRGGVGGSDAADKPKHPPLPNPRVLWVPYTHSTSAINESYTICSQAETLASATTCRQCWKEGVHCRVWLGCWRVVPGAEIA
jgi:hypothetical protein